MRAAPSLIVLFCSTASVAFGQAGRNDLKGEVFLQWGYNRAWFGRSDIHLDGPGYAFTLHDVEAHDRPSPFSFRQYFLPDEMWVPQYNYRAGWHFHDKWSISLGLDHMKYVVAQDQRVGFSGQLATKVPTPQSGQHDIVLSADFLQYEHTDGLNLLSIDLDRYLRLWRSSQGRWGLFLFAGAHAGPVIPRSDVRLLGRGINNRFNIAGFGVGAQAGASFTFLRHFFVRSTLRAGWIDLPNVLTTGSNDEHAQQHFTYVQHAVMLGARFRLKGKEP